MKSVPTALDPSSGNPAKPRQKAVEPF